jgi:hypothetical protein
MNKKKKRLILCGVLLAICSFALTGCASTIGDMFNITDWFKKFNNKTPSLSVILDADQNGIIDIYESDSDEDGLSDILEMECFGTKVSQKDSDENGVEDGQEDHDNDGVVNIDEVEKLLKAKMEKYYQELMDPDGDGLDEDQEDRLGTDNYNWDSDGDLISDYDEKKNKTDPLTPNEMDEVIEYEFDSIYRMEYWGESREDVYALKLIAKGLRRDLAQLEIEYLSNHDELTKWVSGYIFPAFEIKTEGNLEYAKLTITLDENLFEDDFSPMLYQYDEETQCFDEIETTVDGNVLSAEIDGSGIYMFLNKTEREDDIPPSSQLE